MQIEEQVKAALEDALSYEHLHVQGEGSHFQVIIVSESFTGLSRVKKQQLVYKPLSEHIKDGSVHALSIKAFTPDEWQTQKHFYNV